MLKVQPNSRTNLSFFVRRNRRNKNWTADSRTNSLGVVEDFAAKSWYIVSKIVVLRISLGQTKSGMVTWQQGIFVEDRFGIGLFTASGRTCRFL